MRSLTRSRGAVRVLAAAPATAPAAKSAASLGTSASSASGRFKNCSNDGRSDGAGGSAGSGRSSSVALANPSLLSTDNVAKVGGALAKTRPSTSAGESAGEGRRRAGMGRQMTAAFRIFRRRLWAPVCVWRGEGIR